MTDMYRCDEGHWHEGHFTPNGSPCPGGTGLSPTGEPTKPPTDKASLVERVEEIKQRVGQVPDAAGQTYYDEATVPVGEPTKDDRCPTCGSDDPDDRLATGEFGAECLDPWHTKDKTGGSQDG